MRGSSTKDPTLEPEVRPPGAAADEGQAKAAFLLRLRGQGIQNLDILRALERVPREFFVPHHYADMARRGLAVPIGCGQTLSEPLLIARMIEASALMREHRVLEIGTGTGYATAVLAEIADHVVSIERFQSLAIAARMRLEKLAKRNTEIHWADGLASPADLGPFDRILVHGRIEGMPTRLIALLAPGGLLVLARQHPQIPVRQWLSRLSRGGDGAIVEKELWPCRLQSIVPGYAEGM
jgi:protein-L-isoaspartate(D-aspartate) O-methyltransferase